MRGEDVLRVLQDVEWVVGSFVANSDGELLLSLMPPEFGEDELKRTTSRLASIVRCAELCELGVEQCDFSLNRYQLLLRHFRGGLLCVMVEAPVNRRALEMATRLALESLPDLVDSMGRESAAAETLPPSAGGADPEPERRAREATSQSGIVATGEIDLEIPAANEKAGPSRD